MTLLAFSDSHGSVDRMRRLLSMQKPLPDAVIHLGDGCREAFALAKEYSGRLPFYGVRGNCDALVPAGTELPYEKTVTLGGERIFLCHGHTLGVKYGTESLAARAAAEGCSLCLYGHTHVPCDETVTVAGNSVRLICPGSISLPVFGKPSFCVLEIRDGEVLVSLAEADF